MFLSEFATLSIERNFNGFSLGYKNESARYSSAETKTTIASVSV